MVAEEEHSVEVGSDGLVLDAETPITGYGDTALAGHGHQRRPVVCRDRLESGLMSTVRRAGLCEGFVTTRTHHRDDEEENRAPKT